MLWVEINSTKGIKEIFKCQGLCYPIKLPSLNTNKKHQHCSNKNILEGASGAIKNQIKNDIKANQYKPIYISANP